MARRPRRAEERPPGPRLGDEPDAGRRGHVRTHLLAALAVIGLGDPGHADGLVDEKRVDDRALHHQKACRAPFRAIDHPEGGVGQVGFNHVEADGLTALAVLQAVQAGRNYLSSGPRLILQAQSAQGGLAAMGEKGVLRYLIVDCCHSVLQWVILGLEDQYTTKPTV